MREKSIKKTAALLSHMEPRKISRIISFLEEQEADLARRIWDNMVLFTDVLLVDDRGLQNLLQESDLEDWVIALKGADWPLVEKILDNLSPRAAERLREDMVLAGPVRVKDVEAARQTLLKTAKRLQSQGALLFIGKGEDKDLIY